MVHVLLKPENFEHYFTSVCDECNCAVVWTFFGIASLWDWNENWPFPVLWPLLSFDDHQMVNTEIRLIIFFEAEDGEALYSQQKQDWELTGSDHELLTAKFRLKLKKAGKTTRPFRYDLNQIPYDYTVEGTNRFKGLDLIDRLPEELWTEVCDTVQEIGINTISRKKKCKKAK